MAIKRLETPGYGVLELNNVAFRRDGRIEAQCKAADTTMTLENGAILQLIIPLVLSKLLMLLIPLRFLP